MFCCSGMPWPAVSNASNPATSAASRSCLFVVPLNSAKRKNRGQATTFVRRVWQPATQHKKGKNGFRQIVFRTCNPLESIICERTLKVAPSPSVLMRLARGKTMNAIPNRNRLVQSVARILRQLLSGFAPATAAREYPHAARPDVAHGSSRAALGLRPAVKHSRHPAHSERLPASRPRRKTAQCQAPPQGAV